MYTRFTDVCNCKFIHMYVHTLLDNGPTGPKHVDNYSLFPNFSVFVCGFNYEELALILLMWRIG